MLQPDGVTWAEFSPNNQRYFVTACQNGCVTLRELKRPGRPIGRWLHTWQHGSSVYQASFIGRGDDLYVVSVSRDQTARIWDVFTRQQVFPSLNHQAPVSQALFYDKRNTLLTLSKDTVREWKLVASNAAPRDVKPGGRFATCSSAPMAGTWRWPSENRMGPHSGPLKQGPPSLSRSVWAT